MGEPALRYEPERVRIRGGGGAQVRWTQRPSEGTPVALTTKSRYQPGGARVAIAGSCSPSASAPVTWRGRSTRRCSTSSEWVVAPGRIRQADAIWLASGTVAAKKPP